MLDKTISKTVPFLLQLWYSTQIRAAQILASHICSSNGPMGRNGTVQLRVVGEPPRPPRRQRNIDRRPREYLTPAEVEALIATARRRGRYGHRDATMILIAYRHGLRVSELCRLDWSQIDFASGLLHVARRIPGFLEGLTGGHSARCREKDYRHGPAHVAHG